MEKEGAGEVRFVALFLRACSVMTSHLTAGLAARQFPLQPEEFIIVHAVSSSESQTLTTGELSELTALPRSTISDKLRALEAAALLVRVRPEDDKRQTRVVLTAAGSKMVMEWLPVFTQVVEQQTGTLLPKDVLTQLSALVERINASTATSKFMLEYLHKGDED